MLELKHDADGQTILHNSMIVYGCGNTDGDRHSHSNLPVVLAGNGGGALERYRSGTAGGEPDWLAGRGLFERAINRSR